ncbi:MAG: hypothetical protein J7L55_00995 [Desulfurococcales archaeon]|nr:hypothetical protein [Desulfurococcales archaeon]
MGRTAPTLRAAVRAEIARLRKLLRFVRDEELREALEDGLNHAEELHDTYISTEPPMDPMEVVLMSMIAELYRRLRRREGLGSRCEGG